MVARRKSTKKAKFLGRRHFGVGNAKNRRGSGNRGGRGKAGMCKHKWTWAVKYAPNYFGKHGFTRQGSGAGKRMPVVHLYEIDRRALLGQLEKKDGKFAFSFEGKVLSTGSIAHPVSITALAWSKNVEKKLKEAGGEITKIDAKRPEKAGAKTGEKAEAKTAKAA